MPSYWLMCLPYSPSWDAEVRKLAQKHEFSRVGKFTAVLDGIEIWIANYPYACFSPSFKGFRPSRATIFMLRKKLLRETNYLNYLTDPGYKCFDSSTEL